jgi:hypothetical protein
LALPDICAKAWLGEVESVTAGGACAGGGWFLFLEKKDILRDLPRMDGMAGKELLVKMGN